MKNKLIYFIKVSKSLIEERGNIEKRRGSVRSRSGIISKRGRSTLKASGKVMLDISNKVILVISRRAMPEASSKIMPDANNKAMLVINRGVMPDTDRKVALVIDSEAILVASSRAVFIRDELLAAGNKAGPKPREDGGPAALEKPTITIRATMLISWEITLIKEKASVGAILRSNK